MYTTLVLHRWKARDAHGTLESDNYCGCTWYSLRMYLPYLVHDTTGSEGGVGTCLSRSPNYGTRYCCCSISPTEPRLRFPMHGHLCFAAVPGVYLVYCCCTAVEVPTTRRFGAYRSRNIHYIPIIYTAAPYCCTAVLLLLLCSHESVDIKWYSSTWV